MRTGSSIAADEIEPKVSVPTINLEAGRRAFLQTLGVGAVGAAVLGLSTGSAAAQTVSATDVLNFALNLEYLEAEFYLTAIGSKLSDDDIDGNEAYGPLGPVTRGHAVPFSDGLVGNFAHEVAGHEQTHVRFLRGALGPSRVARPAIDVNQSFTAVAQAAQLIGPNDTFDAYANDTNFLLAAFIFEDVGVTAYQGAAQFLSGQTLTYAAGVLAVEAYHAGAIRTMLYQRGLGLEAYKISSLRNQVDGTTDDDRGIGDENSTVIVPVDVNAQTFPRTPGAVLNVVYGTPGNPTEGLFFPAGTNGTFKVAG